MASSNRLEQLLLDQVRALYCPLPGRASHDRQDWAWLAPFWRDVSIRAYRVLKPLGGKKAMVHSVPDGDGLNLSRQKKVRYLGIDAPEVRAKGHATQPYATMARDFNARLVLHREVYLFPDGISEMDEYGRLLRHVFVGGYWINAAMLLTGLAKPSHLDKQEKHLAVMLKHCGYQAQKHHLGLWRHP